jgi:hypothetical protein
MVLPVIPFSSDDLRSRNHYYYRQPSDVRSEFRSKLQSADISSLQIDSETQRNNEVKYLNISSVLKSFGKMTRNSFGLGRSKSKKGSVEHQ